MRAVLDFTDTAFYLHITIEALRELVKNRQIPYGRRGKKIFFVIEDLNAWLRGLVVVSSDEALTHRRHTATFRQIDSPQKPKTSHEIEGDDPVISLVRGAKGRNRERLAKG